MLAIWKKISQGMILGAALSVVAQVQAASSDAEVGALLGWTAPKESDGRFMFGLDGAFEVIDNVSVGAYLLYAGKSVTQTTSGIKTTTKQTALPFGLKVNYLFNDFVPGLYAGANLGMVRTTSQVEAFPKDSSTDFSFGGQFGYDYLLTAEFSLGAQYQYIWVSSDPSGYYNNFLLAGKFRF